MLLCSAAVPVALWLLSSSCCCVLAALCPCCCRSGGNVVTHEHAPGVYLSLQPLPAGGLDLKRVRFSKQVGAELLQATV